MSPQTRRILAMWRGPVFVWAILVLLTAATFAGAYSSLGTITKTAVHFAVVAMQVMLIGVFFAPRVHCCALPPLPDCIGSPSCSC
jgi:hypothetical protein